MIRTKSFTSASPPFLSTRKPSIPHSPLIPLDLSPNQITSLTHTSIQDVSYIRTLFGYANEFKEGDASIGLSAPTKLEREKSRNIIKQLTLQQIQSVMFAEPNDKVSEFIAESVDKVKYGEIKTWSVGQLHSYLLEKDMQTIQQILPGLSSEVIAAIVKISTSEQLISISLKICNSNVGYSLGQAGIFGSRIQPNSATDNTEEILFSVLEGLSYGCGDAVFGINIVASDAANIVRLQETLASVVNAFKLNDKTKWCVLAHIDDQYKMHKQYPQLLDCTFQSIGGNDEINGVFNVSVEKLKNQLKAEDVTRGQYFETGQGSALSNGVANGVDMITLEARAHGLARALQKYNDRWTIVNSVVGFIGPEVFKSAAQLQRACLEDLCMGKLHGLVMGLDICSTYHMGVELEELVQIKEATLAAKPAFYMAVAGNNDPMLSYLTTSYRDHPRLREKFGLNVSNEMKEFFVGIGLMDQSGKMSKWAGDTRRMYVLYKKALGDSRNDDELYAEADVRLQTLQAKDLDLGYGHDGEFRAPKILGKRLSDIYSFAKNAIYSSFSEETLDAWRSRGALILETEASARQDYVMKPLKGEKLTQSSLNAVLEYRKTIKSVGCQIVVSDGLNVLALEKDSQMECFINSMHETWKQNPISATLDLFPQPIFVKNGRVRVGYNIGRELFKERSCILHIIGERPGNGKNTFSVYITCTDDWKNADHSNTQVVSGISVSSLLPSAAAKSVLYFLT